MKDLRATNHITLTVCKDPLAASKPPKPLESCIVPQDPDIADVSVERSIASCSSPELSDIETICDKYRNQTGAGLRQPRGQSQGPPIEVIDLTVSDDEVAHNAVQRIQPQKRSRHASHNTDQSEPRNRPRVSPKEDAQAVARDFFPVLIMIEVENSLVQFKWDEALQRWHNQRSDDVWELSVILDTVVYVQALYQSETMNLSKVGRGWEGCHSSAGRKLFFKHEEVKRMIRLEK